MSEIMKKTHKDSSFFKIRMKADYTKQLLVDIDKVVLQTMVLNDKEVIAEVVSKAKYEP